MEDALIRNRSDRYEIQLQKKYIPERRNYNTDESQPYDLDVKWQSDSQLLVQDAPNWF